MSILQYKYKAHRLVNTLFYIIIFVIGFVLGFGANKIDFNKLISQVLMIDNVQALDATRYDCGSNCIELQNLPNIDNYSNYLFIEQLFTELNTNLETNFDISDYDHVVIRDLSSSTIQHYIYTFSKSKLIVDGYYLEGTDDSIVFGIRITESILYYYINDYKNVEEGELLYSTGGDKFSSENTIGTLNNEYSFELTNVFKEITFNENLFKDNPDFKEVCVNSYDTFSVTSNQITGIDENGDNYFKDYDFMFFPYRVNGITTYIYDTTKENNVYIPENDNNIEDRFLGWWYFLNNKEVIDGIYDKENPGNYLKQKGYTDKYSYYGYMVVPIEMDFRVDKHYYPVFWFKDPYIELVDGTRRLDSEKYCFYIKNEYDVNILNHDSMGDVYGDITILGGTTSSESTSQNKNDLNNSTLLNTLYSLLTRLRSTIDFINYHIELLFFSLPLLFQMFIISVFLIFTLKVIINMIVR